MPNNTDDTIENIGAAIAEAAGGAENLALAVDASLNRGAPSSELETVIAAIHARVASVEHFLGGFLPLFPMIEAGVETVFPASIPALGTLNAIIHAVNQIVRVLSGQPGQTLPDHIAHVDAPVSVPAAVAAHAPSL